MKQTARIVRGAAAMALSLSLGCGGGDDAAAAAAADKKAFEEAAGLLKPHVALIAAYLPHLNPPLPKDKYLPQRRPHLEKASLCAANEIRHAATSAREDMQVADAPSTKALQEAFNAVAIACAEAADPEAFQKCSAAVTGLDGALEKAGASGGPKFPRVAPETITDKAKAALAPFLKARGPGPSEQAYIKKRSDPSISVGDLAAACQTAMAESDEGAEIFEKAEEPLRLIAVTRKMSLDSQCHTLDTTETTRQELEACRKNKNAKTSECAITCGKTKTILDVGVPAALFEPLAKSYEEICEEKK